MLSTIFCLFFDKSCPQWILWLISVDKCNEFSEIFFNPNLYPAFQTFKSYTYQQLWKVWETVLRPLYTGYLALVTLGLML